MFCLFRNHSDYLKVTNCNANKAVIGKGQWLSLRVISYFFFIFRTNDVLFGTIMINHSEILKAKLRTKHVHFNNLR